MSKLDGNGLWSSKFILPEFGNALREHELKSKERKRPILDEDHIMSISEKLSESLHASGAISLRLYGKYEPLEVTGIVTRVDTSTRTISLQTMTSLLKFPFEDIETIY
jgi:hypothetical protein